MDDGVVTITYSQPISSLVGIYTRAVIDNVLFREEFKAAMDAHDDLNYMPMLRDDTILIDVPFEKFSGKVRAFVLKYNLLDPLGVTLKFKRSD